MISIDHIYLFQLSDEPRYAICSPEVASLLGKEILGGILVAPHYLCERLNVYLVGDELYQ